jgi:hypothetical protein
MKRYSDDFSDLLDGFALETLENDPNIILGLSTELTLIYLNPSWFTFARENDGEPDISDNFTLGTYICNHISGYVRGFYLEAYQTVLRTGKVWQHVYECSSPEIFRSFHQTTYPLHNKCGLIIVNSLVEERPHDLNTRKTCQPNEQLYVKDTGLIAQCGNCRRVQRACQLDIWDWVPSWVAKVPNTTSYGICPICLDYYTMSVLDLKSH